MIHTSQPPGTWIICGRIESGSEGHTETIQYICLHKKFYNKVLWKVRILRISAWVRTLNNHKLNNLLPIIHLRKCLSSPLPFFFFKIWHCCFILADLCPNLLFNIYKDLGMSLLIWEESAFKQGARFKLYKVSLGCGTVHIVSKSLILIP